MFFQNPFNVEFIGTWLLGDRQYSQNFKCAPNAGRGDNIVTSWSQSPFDLSGVDADASARRNLTIIFAFNNELYKNWSTVTVDIGGTTLAATTASEIVTLLNANTTFSTYFLAELPQNLDRVLIRQTLPVTRFRFYIQNGTAEEALRFNALAGVAELPTYFMRHTVGGTYRFDFADGQNMLVYLNPNAWATEGDTVAGDVIYHAESSKGISLDLDPTTVREDYELLGGKSGIFNFQKITVDGSDRIEQIIEYPAGAKAGDLGRKINYTYDNGNNNPDEITEIPYTLIAADLITPP
jgi:hypothetical protein